LTTIEVTFDSVNPSAQIRSLVEAFPEMTVGAGTILDSTQARAAIQVGASFLVSPIMSVEVLKTCVEADIPYVPGAATPTEIWSANQAGAAGVKVFPARDLGGPGYLSALRSPLAGISLVPTGRVTKAEVGSYLEAGASAVGLGGSLFSADFIEKGDMEGIAASVAQAVSNAI
jgi:2-dehydro-3-deoxyphosphogluconate aldolase/(4S)-4-hydroxy-2-oxoglutarate aldolase